MLRQILAAMIRDANAARDLRQKPPRLKGGLFIEFYVTAAGENHLLLWRHQAAPSDLEWTTVMRLWPQPLPDPAPAPHPFKNCQHYCLSAHWRMPRPDPFNAVATTNG